MKTNLEYPVLVHTAAVRDIQDPDVVLRLLSEAAAGLAPVRAAGFDGPGVYRAIHDREEQSSTSVGYGLLLPHARLAGLARPVAVIGRPRPPVACETPDGEPAAIVALLLIPEDRPIEGLRFMADVCTAARLNVYRLKLLRAEDGAELTRLLEDVRRNRPQTLVAADIMAPPRLTVEPEMPLKEATRLMADNSLSVLPVVEHGVLKGELFSGELFTLGIPEFFSQLKSVGFIRFFDPFEKYFSVESASTVGDVMCRDCCVFDETATLIEIVFAISVQKCREVCVVNSAGELIGVISRELLLQRIVNL